MAKRIFIGRMFWLLAPLVLLLTACPKPFEPTPFTLEVPSHFPPPSVPTDNPLTVEKVELGKKLFYDTALSGNLQISCASCHDQSLAFSDSIPFSKGVEDRLSLRNAMPLFNLAYTNRFFWDGGVSTLEEQALHPIINELEMDADPAVVLDRLAESEEYLEMFNQAFGTPPSITGIADALASFQRTMLSTNAPYDRYLQGDESAISDAAKRGLELFNSEKAECFHCHTGFNFTDFSFQNNGLYQTYLDEGRKMITGREQDAGKFKVPSLRNITLTAPYMHDGSIETLKDVLDHYGSQGQPHPNRSIFMTVIELTDQEKYDIIAFLETLTDPEFIVDPAFR